MSSGRNLILLGLSGIGKRYVLPDGARYELRMLLTSVQCYTRFIVHQKAQGQSMVSGKKSKKDKKIEEEAAGAV
jgi:hypothetical protein